MTDTTSSTATSTFADVSSSIINATMSTMSTIITKTNCHMVNPSCNNVGVCQDDGTCRCFVGWNPKGIYKGPYDCTGRLTDLPGPRLNLTFGLVFSGVVRYRLSPRSVASVCRVQDQSKETHRRPRHEHHQDQSHTDHPTVHIFMCGLIRLPRYLWTHQSESLLGSVVRQRHPSHDHL